MGFLKKATGALFGNSGKSYDVNAALNQRQNTASDLGNIKWNGKTRTFESSTNDQQRNALINQGLAGLSLDPTSVQDAYYNQATRLLNNQFDQQRRTADTNLINRGIQTGTEQYNQVMGDLQDRQNATLQDIADQAVYMGDANIGQKIGNVNSLAGGRDINTLIGMDSGSNSAYDDKYQSDIYRNAMRNERNANMLSFAGALGGLAFSDKRLKENLKPVGKLNNGLKVYVGNYKKETGLDTTPQLFLLAQEVQKKHPEAVAKKFGALAVNYKQAVKKGE